MGKRGSTRTLSRVALRLTEGFFSHAVDMMLWSVAFTGTLSVPQSTYGQVWRARVSADRFLNEVNYDVIKNAIMQARRRGWMKAARRRHAMPEITEEGKRRLAAIIPRYDEKRTWDGRMHMVTYDIPEVRTRDRDILREYLRKIGCGRLQDSVWVTPYNPIDVLRTLIEERNLRGTVVVSDMGKDGSIGEEDLGGLIVRVYGLEQLDNRYESWLEDVEETRVDHWSVIQYLSILRDDPQLPYELLPKWWKGDLAYLRMKQHLEKASI